MKLNYRGSIMKVLYDNSKGNDTPVLKKRRNSTVVEYYIEDDNSNKQWVTESYLRSCIEDMLVENVKLENGLIVYVKPVFSVFSLNFKSRASIIKYLSKYASDYDGVGMEDLCIYIEHASQNQLSNYWCGVKGNMFVSLFYVEKSKYNIPIIRTIYWAFDDYLYSVMDKLSDKFKDSVFEFQYLPDYRIKSDRKVSASYKPINRVSGLFSERMVSLSSGCYITAYNPNLLVKRIEDVYLNALKDFDINKVVYKCYSARQLSELMSSYTNDYVFNGYWHDEYGNSTAFYGFHYFDPGDLYYYGNDKKYLVAIYNGVIIGVIKFGMFMQEQAVAFIDVHYGCRRKGLAKGLIRNLNNYLDKSLPLDLSHESEMGKLCHMNEKFKEGITVVPVRFSKY